MGVNGIAGQPRRPVAFVMHIAAAAGIPWPHGSFWAAQTSAGLGWKGSLAQHSSTAEEVESFSQSLSPVALRSHVYLGNWALQPHPVY